METKESTITRLKIDNTDIFLEDFEEGQGKITISNTYGQNYSMFWGSMGGTLSEFICRINASYFSDKLLGRHPSTQMDVKKTFRNIRKYIREELGLNWYEHQEFQKDMREKLNNFQQYCDSECDQRFFVDHFFSSFINRLDYYLIKDRYDQKEIEERFSSISEQWYFIEEKQNQNYLFLEDLHKKLIKKLKSKNKWN